MPLALGVHRCQIVATLQDGEQMTHTLWVSRGGIPDPSSANIDPVHLATTVRDAWNSAWTTAISARQPLTMLGSSTRYTKVVAYEMNQATGRANEVAEVTFPTTLVGTASQLLPTEVAAAATLLTGNAGRTRRGRIFLGGFGTTVMLSASGRLSPQATGDLAAVVSAFLRNVRAVNLPDSTEKAYQPVVHSLTTGTARQITQVTVGDVFDVQRRRRNKLVEARSVSAV